MLLKLAVVWTLVQFVEGHFISPNIMGKTLKIIDLQLFSFYCVGQIAWYCRRYFRYSGICYFKVLVTRLFQLFKRRYNRFYGNDVGEYDIKESNKIVE
ncbi:hypothetical protein ACVNP1_10985 [Staphylococcus aureus]